MSLQNPTLIEVVEWALANYEAKDITWTKAQLVLELDRFINNNSIAFHFSASTHELDGLFAYRLDFDSKLIYTEHLISSAKNVLYPMLLFTAKLHGIDLASNSWRIRGDRIGPFKARPSGRDFNITPKFLKLLHRYG